MFRYASSRIIRASILTLGAWLRFRWFGTAAALAGCLVAVGAVALAGGAAVRRAEVRAAQRRVDEIAAVVAARLPHVARGRRLDLLEKVAALPGLDVVLSDALGRLGEGSEPPSVSPGRLRDWLVRERGNDGLVAFRAVTLGPPLQDSSLIVSAPVSDAGSGALHIALALAASLFGCLGVLVAWAVWRDLASSVDDLARQVHAMADGSTASSETVPILSLDEAGDLARAVNRLAAHHQSEQALFDQARGRLDGVDRETSEFLATVSHELRTPLNSILGFSQLLLGGLEGELGESAHEDVRIIEQSGQHLLGIINDILDLSAMESGRIDLSRTMVYIDVLARDVVRAVEGQLRGKPLVLRVDMPRAPNPVDADPRRVRQILTNLVSNATKFTPRGEVVVRARDLGALVEVEVADTGPGIPSGELETIFESYAQLGETKVRRRGTGLGLAISRRLVEIQGGSIRVESELGRGSSFFFTLPRASG